MKLMNKKQKMFYKEYILLYYSTSSISLQVTLNSMYSIIVNWKKIKATKGQKIMSMFALPLFNMLIAMPTCIVAMFKKVKWEPIEHNQCVTQEDLEK